MPRRTRNKKNRYDTFEFTPHKFKKDLINQGYPFEGFVYYDDNIYAGIIVPDISYVVKRPYQVVDNCNISPNTQYDYMTHVAKAFNKSNANEIYKRMYIQDPLNKKQIFPGNQGGSSSGKIRWSIRTIRRMVCDGNNDIVPEWYNKLLKDFGILLKNRKGEQELEEEEYKDKDEDGDDGDEKKPATEVQDNDEEDHFDFYEEEEDEEDRKLDKNVNNIKNWVQLGYISKEKGEKMIEEQLNKRLE